MIGLWIARFTWRGKELPADGSVHDVTLTAPRRLTLFHLVESEIEDRKVTRCGRQMGDRPGTVLAPLASAPAGQGCLRCKQS